MCNHDPGSPTPFHIRHRARWTLTGALATSLVLSLTMTSQAYAQKPASPIDLDARFLRAETSFWDTFGVKLSKNGQQVGPTFFSVVPDEAVAGSSDAKRHAHRARVFHGFVIGVDLAGLGLVAGGFAMRASNEHEWTTSSKLMVGGGLLALLSDGIFILARHNEILAAVNSYNHDLITGRLETEQSKASP
jgi:hypothetical protein